MMRPTFIILINLFLSLLSGAQDKQPVFAGDVNWRAAPRAAPAPLVTTELRHVGTATTYEDINPIVTQIKIDPGTQVIHKGPTRPVVEQLRITGKKITAPEVIEASPLLTRDNAAFNISYTSKQHGFPGNATTDFVEDENHNMWIAADNALMRYDGLHYFLYTPRNGVPEMPGLSFLYDNEKRLWLVSENGIYYMRHDSLFSLRTDQTDFSKLPAVRVQMDAQHRIWLSTSQNGLICIDGTKVNIYDSRCGLPFNSCRMMHFDKDGNLYVAGGNYGVAIIQPDKMVSIFRSGKNIHWNTFNCFYEDDDGLWIGGYNAGFMRINKTDTIQYSVTGKFDERVFDIKKAPNNGLWLSFYGKGVCYFNKRSALMMNADNGLQHAGAYYLYEDSYGNIWVSNLIQGFSRINQNIFYVQRYNNPGLSDLRRIIPDGGNGEWISMYGKGVAHRTGNKTTVYAYSENGNFPLCYPEGIVANEDGSVWIGSYGACMVRVKENIFTSYEYKGFAESRIIAAVQRDRDGKIWFAPLNFGLIVYEKKGFYRYTKQTGLLSDSVMDLFIDREKRINWALKEGFQRMNDASVETLYAGKQMVRRQITALLSINAQTSVLGTVDSGLLIISHNKIYRWSTEHGLASNKIKTIIKDKNGKIWISTDKGIESFLLNENNISDHKIYNQSDGSYIINAEAAFLDNSGMPYWGITDKQLVYNASFTHTNKTAPLFSINRVLIDGKDLGERKKLDIFPNQQVAIDYSTIYWGRENNLKLSYQLISKRDTTERIINTNGTIVIKDFLPGDYTLVWIARDNNTVFTWSPLYISIQNFWYNTWAFRGVVALVIGLLIAVFIKRKTIRQEKLNQLLQSKVAEQTEVIRKEKEDLQKSNQVIDEQNKEKDVLIQEINHRVKNNLQFLEAMIEMQINTDQAKDIIQSLRGTSRRLAAMSLVHDMLYNDKYIQWVSTKKYIEELVNNLREMATDANYPVYFNIQIDDISINVKSATALGMIISESVSNSLKHAFKNVQSPKITVALTRGLSGQLQLHLEDNGRGSDGNVAVAGLGSRLIDIFSRQLGGSYTVDYTNKFLYTLNFKPKESL
jgi:two-component sensor histidine kinase/ligand-binding sensor domain-containing protein